MAENFDQTQGKNSYKFLKESDIIERVEELTATVSSVLSVPPSAASILLRHHRWNPNRLHDAWFSDEPLTRSSSGLFPAVGSSPFNIAKRRKIKETHSEPYTCGICFDVLVHAQSVPADAPLCGHVFCNECWEAYIATSIEGGPACLFLRCPEPSCDVAVGMDTIQRLASLKGFDKYRRYLVGSYVEADLRIKWCPGPGCEYAVEIGVDNAGSINNDVSCRCSHCFCWNCSEESHRPVNCSTVTKWIAEKNMDFENMAWILAFTKPCPKCKRPIEKSVGCNRMTCRAPCFFKFCWLCLTDRENHVCNRYNQGWPIGHTVNMKGTENFSTVFGAGGTWAGTGYNMRDEKRKSAESIQRYKHYFERWATNRFSERNAIVELRLMETVTLENLSRNQSQTVTQLRFGTEAWAQIVKCRRILKWTYVFGYYLSGEEHAKKRFFEFLQGQAEVWLERLHLCAEEDLQDHINTKCPLKTFNDFRMKLTGLTSVTKNYFENLLKALENGLSDVDSR